MNKIQQKRIVRIVAIVVFIIMLFTIAREVINTISVKYQISIAQQENAKLKEEEKKLKVEIAKLKDDKYIQSYVSGTIFSTEKGTTVYVLPKDKNGEKASE